MKLKKVLYTVLSLVFTLSLFFASGCNNQQTLKETSKEGEEKTIAAVTVLPQKAFVEAVCGDLAEVVAIVPPGNSPGNYEPTPQEMEKFSKASVYFTIGVPTEKANILPKAGNMKIVDLPAKVAEVYPDREFSPGKRDPHIWLSPKRAKVMVETIAETMSGLDAGNAQTYRANAAAFLKELDRADTEIKETFAGIHNKKFIVLHPAYGYFADDYGLEMYALEQSGKEATPQHLQDMIDLADAENIKVIFSQAEFDSKQPDAFAEEIGGEKVMLDPLSDDYIANLEKIAQAIAGAMQ
ncbi:zinc ABC transporter substrate-binding protein [Desulfoscipio sp. XC116]|uniref:metal ABC transporter solute-binding protein, Zn/Mn family n=1 Tax=Desulfoscipio sp. XC116 TaxID=3144975 RepID=UPI00325B3DD5